MQKRTWNKTFEMKIGEKQIKIKPTFASDIKFLFFGKLAIWARTCENRFERISVYSLLKIYRHLMRQ